MGSNIVLKGTDDMNQGSKYYLPQSSLQVSQLLLKSACQLTYTRELENWQASDAEQQDSEQIAIKQPGYY